MSGPTIADLRSRLERVTTPDTLPPTHPIWDLLVWLECRAPEAPALGVVLDRWTQPPAVIWWLVDDLVTAAELSARAHVKIVEQAIEVEAWRNSASILSQMLALIVREGKVSLLGKAGEARRAAIAYVARRSARDDVLGVQQATTAALHPWAHKRGVRAAFGSGFHDVENTGPL